MFPKSTTLWEEFIRDTRIIRGYSESSWWELSRDPASGSNMNALLWVSLCSQRRAKYQNMQKLFQKDLGQVHNIAIHITRIVFLLPSVDSPDVNEHV